MSSLKVSQTTLFGRLVKDYMDEVPPMVPSGATCRHAVRALQDQRASSVIVCDDSGRLLGIVTERDVIQQIAFRVPPATTVNEVMSRPVLTIAEDDYVFHAIAAMRRHGFRHMPVVDRRGRLTGVLQLNKALAATIPSMLELIERLTHEATVDGLKRVKSAQVELAEALLQDQVPVPEIQALLTHINNDIHRRIVARSLSELESEGWGKPPVGFDVIVMGSGGRGESFLFPDQDNGFILADYPPDRHPSIDAFFIELAERMTRTLDAVGFDLCRGFVMASNPLWRKSLSEWRQQLECWLRRSNAATLRLSDIFFDFQPVYGDGELAQELRQYVTVTTMQSFSFLQEMQRVQSGHGVALGLFGRLTPDDTPGPNRGKLNFKYHALLPLVESVRLLSLKEGVLQTATLERISALHEKGKLNDDQQDYLSSAFRHLTEIVLRQQIEDFKAGHSVGAYVSPTALSERERGQVADYLKTIKELRARVKGEFFANMV